MTRGALAISHMLFVDDSYISVKLIHGRHLKW